MHSMLLVRRWLVGVTLWLALVLPGSGQQILINELMAAGQSVLAIQNARYFQEIQDKSEQLALASEHKS